MTIVSIEVERSERLAGVGDADAEQGVVENDEAIGVWVWERAEEDVVDDGKGGGAGADAQAESENGRCREEWSAGEGADDLADGDGH
jgi:hypothetical protein